MFCLPGLENRLWLFLKQRSTVPLRSITQRKVQKSSADLQQSLPGCTCRLSHWHCHLVLTLSLRRTRSIMNAHPPDSTAEKNGAARKGDVNLRHDKQLPSRWANYTSLGQLGWLMGHKTNLPARFSLLFLQPEQLPDVSRLIRTQRAVSLGFSVHMGSLQL